MFETIKDFFVFCYKATEKMEEKSKQIHEERQERWDEFREKTVKAKQDLKEKMDDRKTELSAKFKSDIKEWLKESGFATREEVDNIQKNISNIEKKIDKLLK